LAEVARLFPELLQDAAEGGALDPQFGLTEAMRIVEALLFAASEPLDERDLQPHLPQGVTLNNVLLRLQRDYAPRGVNLVKAGRKWTFRTSADLGWLLSREEIEPKRLSRAGQETLAIIAYHQPVTRAEIEDIRGVALSKGTLDLLFETGWIRLRGRRRAPGRPLTYGTSESFLLAFGLDSLVELPSLDELAGLGLDGDEDAGGEQVSIKCMKGAKAKATNNRLKRKEGLKILS
jgi:segregation and condensation protein B